jgi:hypothetical protein
MVQAHTGLPKVPVVIPCLCVASHLCLSFVCSYGRPVTDMLANSLPLPLAIDYVEEDREITAEDEGGILLALQHHH